MLGLCAVTVSIVLPKWTKHTKPNQLEIQWHQDSLISISASLKIFAKHLESIAHKVWRHSLPGQALNAIHPAKALTTNSEPSPFELLPLPKQMPSSPGIRVTCIRVGRLAFRWFCWVFWEKRRTKKRACPRKHLKIRHQKRSESIPASDLEFSLTLNKKTNIETREKRDAETRNLALPKALLSPVHFRSCVPTKIKGRSKTPPLWQLSRMQVKRHPAGKGRTKVWNSLSGTRRRLPGRCFFLLAISEMDLGWNEV